jgi:predicted porin
MKKTLIALATLAAAGTAFAQSSVTISGSIQAGVIDTGAATAQPTVGSFGSGANAINIASTEDLGGGLKGGFSGQIRFSAATGDANSAASPTNTYGGALFHTANAFVSGGFGTVRVGKIAEASTCAFDPWGCGGGAALQAGGISTAPGGTGGALIGAAAVSNALAYTTPTINGFSAGYQTSLSPKAGQTLGRTNERETFNISYAKGPLNLAYINIKGGGNAGASSGPVSDDASTSTAIAGSYNFGVATLSVVKAESKGNVATTANNKDITSVGLTVPMGAYTILGGYNKDSKAAANADTQISAGVNYALSKRTTLGADLVKVEAHAGTGFVTRLRHSF